MNNISKCDATTASITDKKELLIAKNLTINSKQYKRDALLSTGSFGICYRYKIAKNGKKSKHQNNNEEIAVKIIHKTIQLTADELEMHQSLTHTNIINIINVQTINNTIYMSMDLCQCDLNHIHLTYNPLDIKRTKKLMIGALNGLKYIHSKNIVHRDFKLTNLLLSMDGETVKICDFGLACYANTKLEHTCGTIPYMAPEVYYDGGHKVTQTASDMWSIGVCMYILLLGENPFRKSTETFLISTIGIYKKPYWFKRLPGGLAVLKILEQLFELNVSKRPTAAKLLQMHFFQTDEYDENDTLNHKHATLSIDSLILTNSSGSKIRCKAIESMKTILKRSHSYTSNMLTITQIANQKIIHVLKYTETARDSSIAYVLNNGNIAMLYADFTTVLIQTIVKNKILYLDHSDENIKRLSKANQLFVYKANVLDLFIEELLKSIIIKKINHTNSKKQNDEVIIHQYIKTHNAIIFILSNNTIQIDFFLSHLKIIIYDNMVYFGKFNEKLMPCHHISVKQKLRISTIMKLLIHIEFSI